MALCAGLHSAQSEPLSVINVVASALNCVYDSACGFMVVDTVATIPIGVSGRAALQTRSFTGATGSPAAGKTGYQFRVNLSGAVGRHCVSAFKLPFGEIVKLPYLPNRPYADIFVVASGDLGTIGIGSADKTGDTITFSFSKPVCAGASTGRGESSLFFGLTANEAPKAGFATVELEGGAPARVPVRTSLAPAEEPKAKPKAKGKTKAKSKPRSRSSAPRGR